MVLHKHTNAKPHKHTNTQIHKHTNAQARKRATAHTHKAQARKCANAQTYRHTTAHAHRTHTRKRTLARALAHASASALRASLPACPPARPHARTCTRTRTRTCTCTRTRTAHALDVRNRTQQCMHAHTHARAHPRTCTQAHTHTDTRLFPFQAKSSETTSRHLGRGSASLGLDPPGPQKGSLSDPDCALRTNILAATDEFPLERGNSWVFPYDGMLHYTRKRPQTAVSEKGTHASLVKVAAADARRVSIEGWPRTLFKQKPSGAPGEGIRLQARYI